MGTEISTTFSNKEKNEEDFEGAKDGRSENGKGVRSAASLSKPPVPLWIFIVAAWELELKQVQVVGSMIILSVGRWIGHF